jgi:hypothetical protein
MIIRSDYVSGMEAPSDRIGDRLSVLVGSVFSNHNIGLTVIERLTERERWIRSHTTGRSPGIAIVRHGDEKAEPESWTRAESCGGVVELWRRVTQRRRGSVRRRRASHRFSAALRSGCARVLGGVADKHDEPRRTCPGPPPSLLLWRYAMGAHVPLTWPCAPDRGAWSNGLRIGRWTDPGRDQSNILPFDLYQLTHFLRSISLRSVHRACLVSTVITAGLTATTHFSV